MNANRLPICFWCSIAPATHQRSHEAIGLQPTCDACDPATAPDRRLGDVLDKMTGVLVASVQLGNVDLGDGISVDRQLRVSGFSQGSIDIYEERAVERARRLLQRTAARLSRQIERIVDGGVLASLLIVWGCAYAIVCPAEPHRHAPAQHFVSAR